MLQDITQRRIKPETGLVAAMIIVVAIWRFPFDQMRVGFELMFRCGVIFLLAAFIYRRANKWLGLFLGLAIVSHLFPFYTRHTYVALVNVLMGCMFYAIVVLTVDRTGCERLMDMLCIIALANVVFLALQALNIDTMFVPISGGRVVPAGMMANRNETSALLALCMPAFFRGRWRWLLPLILAGLIIPRSNGGVVAAGCGFLLYASLHGYALYGGFAAVIGMGLYILFVDGPSIAPRWETWQIGWHCIKQHWLLGAGIGHWQDVFRGYAEHGAYFKQAHNEYVQGVFEMGIGFAVIAGGYMANVARRAYKRRRDVSIPLTALAIIAVNSTFNFLFHVAVTAMIALTWMAILEIEIRN